MTRTRERCAVALMDNHDYGATGSAETNGLGRVAAQVRGAVLITAVVLALGSAGWLLLAAPGASAPPRRC